MGKRQLTYLQHPTLPLVYNVLSRRMFLRGMGATMAIPLLPSLLPKAYAAAASPQDYRRVAFLPWSYGAYWDNWAPTGVNLVQQGNNVKAGSLANATLGSYFPSDFGNIQNKITVFQGLDYLNADGHCHNTALGAGGHTGNNNFTDPRTPNTIDVLLSRSLKVYGGPPKIDVLRSDPYGLGSSHCYEDGQGITLGINNSQDLFTVVTSAMPNATPSPMPSGPAPLTPPQRALARQKLMVDNSYSAFQRLINSTKIAMSDIPILQNFFDYLRDVQTSINSTISSGTSTVSLGSNYSCTPTYRTDSSDLDRAQNMADISILALSCGVTKIAYLLMYTEHTLVHAFNDPGSRDGHVQFMKSQVLPVASYMMNRMNAITEGNGNTMLDNCAVMVSSDLASSSFDNHNGLNVPVVVGGGLNGMLRTGQMISYYDQTSPLIINGQYQQSNGLTYNGIYPGNTIYGGRPYNDLLLTIMKSFGLTSADYGPNGYGVYDCQNSTGLCTASNEGTEQAVDQYYASKYLPANPNRDVALPYYFLGT